MRSERARASRHERLAGVSLRVGCVWRTSLRTLRAIWRERARAVHERTRLHESAHERHRGARVRARGHGILSVVCLMVPDFPVASHERHGGCTRVQHERTRLHGAAHDRATSATTPHGLRTSARAMRRSCTRLAHECTNRARSAHERSGTRNCTRGHRDHDRADRCQRHHAVERSATRPPHQRHHDGGSATPGRRPDCEPTAAAHEQHDAHRLDATRDAGSMARGVAS